MSDDVQIATPAGPAVLRRSDRATLAISVLPNGTLDLVAPRDCTEADVVAKVSKRLRWIVRQRTTFADMNRDRMPLRYESGATHRYLGRNRRRTEHRGHREHRQQIPLEALHRATPAPQNKTPAG